MKSSSTSIPRSASAVEGTMRFVPSLELNNVLSTNKASLFFTFSIGNRLTRMVAVSAGKEGVVHNHLKPDIPLRHTATGISEDHQKIWLAGPNTIYRFKNAITPRYDCDGRLFFQQSIRPIGNIYPLDLSFDKQGDGIFLTKNALFDGVGLLKKSAVVPLFTQENLNELLSPARPQEKFRIRGLALRDGIPRYLSCSISVDREGLEPLDLPHLGAIIDIVENRVLTQKVFAPLLPRWNKGQLWFFNTGNKTLAYICPDSDEPYSVLSYSGEPSALTFYHDILIMGTTIEPEGPDNMTESNLSFIELSTQKIMFVLKILGVATILKDCHVLPVEGFEFIQAAEPAYLTKICQKQRSIKTHYFSNEEGFDSGLKIKWNLEPHLKERNQKEREEDRASRIKYQASIGFWQRNKPSTEYVWAALLFWATALFAIMLGMGISLRENPESRCPSGKAL